MAHILLDSFFSGHGNEMILSSMKMPSTEDYLNVRRPQYMICESLSEVTISFGWFNMQHFVFNIDFLVQYLLTNCSDRLEVDLALLL